MEYLQWEGVIPKGEYGGGTMIVWDRGTWTPEGDPHAGLKKGHLDFTLHGKRLKGGWHLVRMSKKAGEKRDNWLLIKAKDEFARRAGDPEIVEEEICSSLSGRTNEELATANAIRPDHAARGKVDRIALPALKTLKGAKKGILPVFVPPSLATLRERPPSGPHWLHEIKYDGYRMQARLDGGKVKLMSRKGLDWTARFPTIAAEVERLPAGSVLLDGEIVAQTEEGQSSFSALQADLKAGRRDRLVFYIFDLLYADGVDIRGAALRQRKELLATLVAALPADSRIQFSEDIEGNGSEILAHACRLGFEGIVSKRADRPYISDRGDHWIKSKCVLRQEFVVIGYVPSSARRHTVGSLVLGYYDKGKLVHAGRAGTGYSQSEAASLFAQLDKDRTSRPQFGTKLQPGAERDVVWTTPKLVAEIEYRSWTNDGLLRQAAYKGLREDKLPEDVVLEQKRSAMPAREAPSIEQFRLTHPERILWKGQGVTKRGLAEFYAGIADWILPHVTGRVLSVMRCPSGEDEGCFYVKHVWQGAPDAIKEIDVGDEKPMLAIENLEGLIALVQAGVLEIHPWGSRVENLEKPDRVIFDLDPGDGVAWRDVIAGALEIHKTLQGMGLKSFVKTSGGKGLHVVLPIAPKSGWDEVKSFAKSIADGMATGDPDRYVAKMTKSIRRNRIFIDYLRNSRGATSVAAYSTRAKPDAPVSTPLAWDELSETIGPRHFTIANLRQRLDYLKSDPWDGFFELRQSLKDSAS
jgi:bifunctional non-homologous end joining protein LigD